MKQVAISIGDLNGIGIELALRCHEEAKTLVDPIYLIDREMLKQAADLLDLSIPDDFIIESPGADPFTIQPGTVSAAAGAYSFASFKAAVELCSQGDAEAVCTLPIHKKAWELAGIPYKGHTDALRDFFDREAIMMLGCPQMYVGLYTEHIPLKDVPKALEKERLTRFLLDFQQETGAREIAVLGLNPHAGDHGVLGDEETIIEQAITQANHTLNSQFSILNSQFFIGPLVPDTAFTPAMRERFRYYVAMYHDQGLIPLKALHFDESINVSLNLPILRTSVDHGTAFDIAYQGKVLNTKSYLNALRYITERPT
ncbi:4-hydroxythreonine-4-phosphate dehydrogenase [Nitratifractor sp.]|uniref:4-hydroxythreonine-4-phosphate dehydrogenase n=1 Tax=Nitratifractor sp. TaxID=2268144 RepID=UPI0025EAB00A|nr:4-hydroxythreonine-4-phosphate dehydrogenase [Nitratifractor sp.]